MRVTAAVLCDFAQVREGLLTIVSAGITRMWREEMPAPLGLFLALIIEVDAPDRLFPHEVTVVVTAPSGKEIAKAGGGFQINQGAGAEPDEVSLVPLPLDLRIAGIEEFGWYTFTLAIDSQPAGSVQAKVVKRPQPAPGVNIPTTQGKPN